MKSLHFTLVVFAVVAGAWLFAAAEIAVAAPGARLVVIEGAVSLDGKKLSDAKSRLSYPRRTLAVGSTVSCGDDGVALVRLPDGTVSSVSPRSSYVVPIDGPARAEPGATPSAVLEIVKLVEQQPRNPAAVTAGATRGDEPVRLVYPSGRERVLLDEALSFEIDAPREEAVTLRLFGVGDGSLSRTFAWPKHSAVFADAGLVAFLREARTSGETAVRATFTVGAKAQPPVQIFLLPETAESALLAELAAIATQHRQTLPRALAIHAAYQKAGLAKLAPRALQRALPPVPAAAP